jgi:hypothetical protein
MANPVWPQYRLDKVDDLLEMSRTECSRGRSSSRAGLAEPLRPTSSSDLNLISMLQVHPTFRVFTHFGLFMFA